MARRLTIREANRLARGRAKVSVDAEDRRLWRVERPGSVQAHEPMTREAWLDFLGAGEGVITTKQAETILPTVRAAVAALHEVWARCREVERAIGHDLDGLEGVIQNMAAGVDNPASIDAAYVREAVQGLSLSCDPCLVTGPLRGRTPSGLDTDADDNER